MYLIRTAEYGWEPIAFNSEGAAVDRAGELVQLAGYRNCVVFVCFLMNPDQFQDRPDFVRVETITTVRSED